jgi:hypothetical protein
MEKLSEFDFLPLQYGDEGQPISAPIDELKQHIQHAGTTDLILIAHGFRNNEQEARGLFGDFLKTFRGHIGRDELKDRLTARKIAVAGIFWPSKAFSEGGSEPEAGNVQGLGGTVDEMEATRAQLEQMRDHDVRPDQRATVDRALALLDTLEDDTDKQDEFVQLILSLVDDKESDPTEGLRELKAQAGSDLLAKLGTPIILPTIRDDGEGSTLAVDTGAATSSEGRPLMVSGFFKSVAGRVGQVLNLTTWYMMKNRSGDVGANGVAAAVRAVKAAHPTLRIHLVGHSLGGRCMAACAKALAADPKVRPDSLSLLEAAFSHYGLSPNNGKGSAGFFRDVIARQVVKGPFISTYSYQDTVVGKAYAISSRLAGDNVKEVGDKNDQFGGIGRNGTQLTPEANDQRMRQVGDPYTFNLDVVNNVDGSGGAIKDHSDVTNPQVTYAFACAMAQT